MLRGKLVSLKDKLSLYPQIQNKIEIKEEKVEEKKDKKTKKK